MNPDERASQNVHAAEVRGVRILTKTLGCTRSQAIQAIRLQQAQRNQPVNPNAGNRVGNLFQEPPQIKRSEVITPDTRPAPVLEAQPLLVPPVLPPEIGDWLTVGVCIDGVTGFRQVLSRPVP